MVRFLTRPHFRLGWSSATAKDRSALSGLPQLSAWRLHGDQRRPRCGRSGRLGTVGRRTVRTRSTARFAQCVTHPARSRPTPPPNGPASGPKEPRSMTELTTSTGDPAQRHTSSPRVRARSGPTLCCESTSSGVGFGGRLAVDQVSFSVERGEVLALVGESGSGKTVTAKAILGLLPRTARSSGSIQLTDDPGRATGGSSTQPPGAAESRLAQRPWPRSVDGLPGAPDRAEPGEHRRLASLTEASEGPSSDRPIAAARAQRGRAVDPVGIPEPQQRAKSIRISCPAARSSAW